MKVAVLTASIGSPLLARCIESVAMQTHGNLTHFVLADGPQVEDRVSDTLRSVGSKRATLVTLPQNTGGGGHKGNRIYAAAPLLCDADVIALLDDDNLLDETHIERGVDALRASGATWCNSLRRISNKEVALAFDDDCESLGGWPRLLNRYEPLFHPDDPFRSFLAPRRFLADTSTLMYRRAAAEGLVTSWLTLRASDAVVTSTLVSAGAGVCTGARSVCYTVPEHRFALYSQYYRQGNDAMLSLFDGERPWIARPGESFTRHPRSDEASRLLSALADLPPTSRLATPTCRYVDPTEVLPGHPLLDTWYGARAIGTSV